MAFHTTQPGTGSEPDAPTLRLVHKDEQPPLSLVKDTPTETAQQPTPAPIEGTVVEHQGRPQPAWIQSGKALAKVTGRHPLENWLYLGWTARGYRRLVHRWLDGWRDDYPHMIRTARAELKAASTTGEQSKAKSVVRARRADYFEHRWKYAAKTGGWTLAAAGGTAAGVVTGGALVDLLMAVAAVAVGAWHGRPQAGSTGPKVIPGVVSATPAQPESTLGEQRSSALGEAMLLDALRSIGVPNGTRLLDAPPWGADGTAITTFDLPAGFPVTALRKKAEALAGALGRDTSMIDIAKAGTANRCALWVSDSDPFETPRPSPLLNLHGAIDAWNDGVPVAWDKRGVTISLVINNSSFVIGGMTRSGKGVGAANLVSGAALDPRINLRIVAGKSNGEWDPAAKAGVAATYFKPNPERLLALLKALLADKDRRERDLGRLGKSKLIPEVIEQLGGIELLVIDELATYTRPGKPLREEILEALIELSAVAAGAGILVVLITQYPEADVIPQGLAMNCGTRWAMRVDNAIQSNAILGGSASSGGRDASKFDPPRPGLGWLVNPFAGVTDLARSFDLDEDRRGEVTRIMSRAAELREAVGRLAGQWDDPIERHLVGVTGLSSVAGGPQRNGEPGRVMALQTPEQRQQVDALRGALAAMDRLGRGEAQLDEMASIIGSGMTADRLGELLRGAGAGGTVKITVPHRSGRVNGYLRADIEDALRYVNGT